MEPDVRSRATLSVWVQQGNITMNGTTRITPLLLWAILSAVVTACGGGGGNSGGGSGESGGESAGSRPATAAVPAIEFRAIKTFRFTWTDVPDAQFYRLLENPDGSSGFTQAGEDIPQGTQIYEHVVPLHARVNAQYILQSCNSAGCVNSMTLSVSGNLAAAIGYFKASNTESGDNFGSAVAISGDGNTLAVGAPHEDSSATGVGGDERNGILSSNSGAVYVFTRSGGDWSQQAYVKAGNTGKDDNFGLSISLDADGNTLAVGAPGEASGATGINGDAADNSAVLSGAVYVFTRSSSGWSQQAYVKANNTGGGDQFGSALSLSADGNTLAVGAFAEDSNATGVNGDAANDGALESGAVYIFTRSAGNWSQQAYVKASNTGTGDRFGTSVSLSADSDTLAVGARLESSGAMGINGDGTDNSKLYSGAAYIFTRSGASWSQQAYIKASNTGDSDRFGGTVSLSANGDTLAVGAIGEASAVPGIDDEWDNSAPLSGAVYIFVRAADGMWSQQAYLKAGNPGAADQFGGAISLSGDGVTLAVGAVGEDSSAIGINGDATDNSAQTSGAAYVFSRSSGTWLQQAYVKAGNTEQSDYVRVVALSSSGDILAVGATGEDGGTTGIGGNWNDNGASLSGAVYLY